MPIAFAVSILILLLNGCASSVPVAYIKDAKLLGKPAIITAISLRMNSYGGVGPLVRLTNTSGKVYKYVGLTLLPYNAVGDRTSSPGVLKFPGPIYPDITSSIYTTNVMWNDSSIKCAEVNVLNLTYMDGTEDSLRGDEVKKLMYGAKSTSCAEFMKSKIIQ